MGDSYRRDKRGYYNAEEEEPPFHHPYEQRNKRSSADSYDRARGGDAKRYRRDDEYRHRKSSRGDDYYRDTSQDESFDYYGDYGRGSSHGDDMQQQQQQQQDDWKCLECMTWNYPEDQRCARCGLYPDEEEPHRGYEEAPEQPIRGDEEQETDEFGRAISAQKKNQPQQQQRESREWPPHFDKNGSDYQFDARSGMFYEAESDFFYDPKSKLYYGNKKGAYYRYNEESTDAVPFEQVQKVDPSEKTTTDLEAEPALAPQPKKGISIKLKTKSLKSKKEKGAGALTSKPASKSIELPQQQAAPATRQQKQHAVDMNKWSERQVEKRAEAAVGEEKPEEAEAPIKRTAKGEPMCALCRRKFPSVEKLLYHNRVSKLHKENLAKQQAAAKAAGTNQHKTYVDRAEQRRMMHGPETPAVALPPLPSSSIGNLGPDTAASDPQEQLGEANIGNQLLQKMGWKAGNPVGRQDRHQSGASRSSTESSVVKEWERIEGLSANGGRKSTPSHLKPGLGS